MRRISAPRVSRTNPVRSPSVAAAVTVAVRSRPPGTDTVGATAIAAPVAVATGSTATSHTPAPPPASARFTWTGTLAPGRTSPNETEAGDASTSGTSALSGLASPPPARIGVAVWLPSLTAVPVAISAALRSATVQVGWRSSRRAATPAICGVAIDVPDIASQWPPGTEDRIETPGALTSGFSRSDSGVGPAELKSASVLPPPASGLVTAATVIARSEVPGEMSDPPP